LNLSKPKRRFFGSRRHRSYSAAADAARRATRARDHLERKRAQERRRRERERAHSDRTSARVPVRISFRRSLSLVALVLATMAGIYAAAPVSQRVLAPVAGLERIDVQGATILAPEAIVRAAGLHRGNALEDLDLEQIVAAIEAEPWIESARVLQLPTGTLVISVVERNAIAIWQSDPTSEARLVDSSGRRFDGALEPAGELPRVRGEAGAGADTLPGDALEILGAIERHATAGGLPNGLTLYLPVIENGDDVGYVLQLGPDGPRAVLGRQLYAERLARLAALVESGESTFRSARLIDLRYADRAVLRAEPISG
jgi:cell division septal protein FtsQ